MLFTPRPNPVDARFTEVLDALLRLRREDIRVSGLHLKTQGFLWTAYGLGINEPGATPRLLQFGLALGRTVDFAAATARPVADLFVRVGSRFTLDMGVDWRITVTEDTEP